MLNQIVLVGRLIENPIEVSKDKVTITLAIPRSYKNKKGEYDTDFIDITLWSGIASNTLEYCKKGDLIGVKGSVHSNDNKDKNSEKKYIMEIVAEKVTFLSSKASKEEDK